MLTLTLVGTMSELQAVRTWLETRPDEEVQRVADATAWQYSAFSQAGAYDGGVEGCLICHASGNRYISLKDAEGIPSMDLTRELASPETAHALTRAESAYMSFADRHGNEAAGRAMNALAREILATRKLALFSVGQVKKAGAP